MRNLLGRKFGRRILEGIIISVAACAAALPASAQSDSEALLKAAVFAKLAGFVEWAQPVSTATSVVVCVLADPNFEDLVKRIIAAQPPNERLMNRQIRNPQDSAGCNFLFLRGHAPGEVSEDAVQGTVTVSDEPGFAESGGMIELRVEDRHIRFVVNSKAAAAKGIKFRAQLLALAEHVI